MIIVTYELLHAVNGQQAQQITDSYLTVNGSYDVNNNYTAPSSSPAIIIPALSSYLCQYACMVTTNCILVVLKANNTCYVYNSSTTRTSVYASTTNSTIYQRQINGYRKENDSKQFF
jgi:hypothetical protein